METYDVISAFLDNEPFDSVELARALAEPDGRELLLDLVALRAVVSKADPPAATATSPANAAAARRTGMIVGFLAASLLFAAAGALLRQPARDVPPKPDHVVTFDVGSSH